MLGRMFIDAPEDLQSSTCILLIDIDLFYDETDGKERLQEGENLAATIYMLNQLKLRDCVIVMADLLQRHNVIIDSNEIAEHDAKAQAILAGEGWKARNEHIIARLTMSYKVIYWNQLNEHPCYPSQRRLIQGEYDEKAEPGKKRPLFKSLVSQVVRNVINGFGRGYLKGRPDEMVYFDVKLAVDLSIECLLEELAVISLWRDGLCRDLVEDNEKIFMMCSFGKSTPSRDLYNCIQHVCNNGGNLGLKDIKKGELVSTKVASQHKQESGSKKQQDGSKKDKRKKRELTSEPMFTAGEASAEQADDSVLMGQVILGILRLSRLTIRDQIAVFRGATDYVCRQLELEERALTASIHQELREEGESCGVSTAERQLSSTSGLIRRSASFPSILLTGAAVYTAKRKDTLYSVVEPQESSTATNMSVAVQGGFQGK